MRRLLAIAILLNLALPAISPLFALTGNSDPSRPACCRRDGKHHCMGMMEMASASNSGTTQAGAAIVTDRCPFGSQSVPATPHTDWSLDTSSAIFAGVIAHPAIAPQTESKRRISADRSRQKRGPPAAQFFA